MKRRFVMFLATWCLMLALMVVQKPLFMLLEPAYSAADLRLLGRVISSGLTMDMSMSSYLVAPVLLWLIASVWVSRPYMGHILRGYYIFVAIVLSASGVIDAVLYPYWGFRLDSTPLFYFVTAPSVALASVSWWFVAGAVVLMAVLAWAIYSLLSQTLRLWRRFESCRHRILATVAFSALGAVMIIPIRGGVTVSTMSPGRAYFTSDMRLNHAAQNPLFTFVHSLTHADRLSSQYRYFDEDVASRIAAEIHRPSDTLDSIPAISLTSDRPDIYLIILESFSAHLMPSLGGDSIAMNLDSIAASGVLFTNFYAESFRTDRALATILSGYPSLPTTSVFRYTGKFGNLPSLSSELSRIGYETEYYYGGDIDFTNLRAYLVATGYDRIISDKDFPVARRISKWGAHDEDVFARVLADIASADNAKPALRVIQTSSSHEPFDVPYRRFVDDRANAFAYADSCLGDFVQRLSASPRWDKSLVVIVPDHWGAYPPNLEDPRARHHVPLVLTGGTLLGAPARIGSPASQSGIAPTILALIGADYSMFVHARDMLDSQQGQYAWFSEPEWMALIDAGGNMTRVEADAASVDNNDARRRVGAFVQTLYHDIDKR